MASFPLSFIATASCIAATSVTTVTTAAASAATPPAPSAFKGIYTDIYDTKDCKGHIEYNMIIAAQPGNCLPYPNKKDVWYSVTCARNVGPGNPDAYSILRHFYKDSPTCNTTDLILDATEVYFQESTNCYLISDWFDAASMPDPTMAGKKTMNLFRCIQQD